MVSSSDGPFLGFSNLSTPRSTSPERSIQESPSSGDERQPPAYDVEDYRSR
ncbi:hypothetical protein NDU88_000887, partial [Pleurodeles waltl]